jgi:low temperature requirement protein LtrA
MNAMKFLKERRSPVRRVFSSLYYGHISMHTAVVVVAVTDKFEIENQRRTGDRRSLQK